MAREEIAALPPGSVTLCSSKRFPNQAFRVGPCAWGTQFHPEVLTSMATTWAEPDSAEIRLAGLTPELVVAGVAAAKPEPRTAWGTTPPVGRRRAGEPDVPGRSSCQVLSAR